MQVSFECRDPAGRRLRVFAVNRVRQSLRRVAWLVPRVQVHMADVNGPAGGTDKQCRVVLNPRRGAPINSPEAAARIVSLALHADGHFCRGEPEAIDGGRGHVQPGITAERLHAVVHGLCGDLLATSNDLRTAACAVDRAAVSRRGGCLGHPSPASREAACRN